MSYEKAMELSNEKVIEESLEIPKLKLHKWLIFGQTEHACIHGTLSEGHEKITKAQKYAQALREIYYLSINIKMQKVVAKRAKADLLDALEMPQSTASEKLRKEAKIEEANLQLLSASATIEDQMRMVRTYQRVIEELAPIVEAQYPGGIEEAEPDNWKAVAAYRRLKQSFGSPERFDNILLSAEDKAKLGVETSNHSMGAYLAVQKASETQKLTWNKCLAALNEVKHVQTASLIDRLPKAGNKR